MANMFANKRLSKVHPLELEDKALIGNAHPDDDLANGLTSSRNLQELIKVLLSPPSLSLSL